LGPKINIHVILVLFFFLLRACPEEISSEEK